MDFIGVTPAGERYAMMLHSGRVEVKTPIMTVVSGVGLQHLKR